MFFMAILLAFVVYVAIAVAFVLYVRRRTRKRLHLWLAIAFVILLPTWDVVLGYLVYYPACLFVPKTVIHETAETEGIYYEGDRNHFLLDLSDIAGPNRNIVSFASSDFQKGYKNVEALITEQGDSLKSIRISPVVYRCEPISFDPHKSYQHLFQCIPASKVQSEYRVRTEKWIFGLTEIRLVNIFRLSTGKLMAEHREVLRWINNVPFFLWLNMGDGSSQGISCPIKSRYHDFHYDVLKPKK
jgi:hypothetical protein